MAKKKLPDPSELKYDAAIAEVEGIIDRIESGEIDLEESMVVWERGVKLLAHCRGVLERAEKKIEALQLASEAESAEGSADDDASSR